MTTHYFDLMLVGNANMLIKLLVELTNIVAMWYNFDTKKTINDQKCFGGYDGLHKLLKHICNSFEQFLELKQPQMNFVFKNIDCNSMGEK